MRLFHGTDCRHINHFDLDKGRKNVDFGKGVYFTTNFQQACEWSCNRTSAGAVYECEIDLSILTGLTFFEMDDDACFYIYLCRLNLEGIVPDAVEGAENADYITGVMLDGKIKGFESLAEQFNEGDLTLEEFKEKIKLFDCKTQTCIKSKKALNEINANIKKVYFTQKIGSRVFVEEEIPRF